VRYGRHVGVSPSRIKVGQFLFGRHGSKVVFFGRFVALLRILAAFLAGVNHMPWRRFLIANAAGAVLWASVFGIGGFDLEPWRGTLFLACDEVLADHLPDVPVKRDGE
jgi:membrane protein DedA with SNARE-associated domain